MQPAIHGDQSKHNSEECKNPQCEICKRKKPFKFPSEIVEAYKKGQLIIFAGAGISTERKGVFPTSFYEDRKIEIRIPKEEKISFSKLMTKYCEVTGSRKHLLKAIKDRLDYVTAFPELYWQATEFHRELSTIPHLDEIFTTNWDDFFERECDATPIVTGEDFAVFQDIPGRKVFKIHGSVRNYGSIVATEEDYSNCYRRLGSGVIGAILKHLLVSKTIIFVGFSLEDDDFQKIYRLLKKDTKGIMPLSYVVTLDEHTEEKIKTLKTNTFPIITDAAYFIQEFKKKLVEEKLMLSDTNFSGISEILEKALFEHHRLASLNLNEHPDSIYSLAYQDGLIHAFQRAINKMNSGEYSCMVHLAQIIESYDEYIKMYLHNRRYWDVAYFTGYQSGLMYLISTNNRHSIPLYYLFGQRDILNYEQYIKYEREASKIHKASHERAIKIIRRLQPNETTVHHKPF